jgi:hypothetical protein
MTPMRANIVSPPDCRDKDQRGATMGYAPRPSKERPQRGLRAIQPGPRKGRAFRLSVLISNPECPCKAASVGFDRLAQPLHGKFDVLRLQMPPAFNLGLISVFRKAREILRGKLFGGGALPGELLANEGVFRHRAAGESGHALLKRDLSWAGNQSGVEARKITVWVHPDKER